MKSGSVVFVDLDRDGCHIRGRGKGKEIWAPTRKEIWPSPGGRYK